MAPRSSKRKFRARNPVPMWLPLPRPCLRSLNVPGHPYYMPISPEMYLPPWTIPPSYFSKPMCHCANENFCTTSNCQNSAECLKMHPIFCPFNIDHEETSDLQPNGIEQQQNSNDKESSSNSDLNICSACGAPSSKPKTSGKQPKPSHTSKVIRAQHSLHNVQKCNHCLEDIDTENKNISITKRNIDGLSAESDYTSAEGAPLRNTNGCVDSSCQTTFSNTRTRGSNKSITQKKYNLNSPNNDKRSLDSTTDNAEDAETSPNTNVLNPANTNKAPEFGCRGCAEQRIGPANYLEKHNRNSMVNDMQQLAETPETALNSIHVDQLPENISNARKRQANKYSGCCLTGSDKNCKTDMELDTMNTPSIEIPYNNTSKNRKKSECGCHTSSKPKKVPSKSNKITDCICSSTNTPIKESSRFRKKSKCECSPHKMSHKVSSRSHKLSECGCSSTKINEKSYSRKSERSCPSSDNPQKVSSKRGKLLENGFSPNEGSIPKVSSSKLATKKSKKSFNDIASLSETNVRQSGCQCKFPPAYEHLGCTGNENNSCSCNNNN